MIKLKYADLFISNFFVFIFETRRSKKAKFRVIVFFTLSCISVPTNTLRISIEDVTGPAGFPVESAHGP